MSRSMIFTARAEALAASALPASVAVDRANIDAAIEQAIRLYGVQGCAAAVAYEYGERPDLAADRMRWALRTISELYGRR